jgi:uncharacterized membrane protein YvbJ
MAMIYCNECGKEISDKADKCPHCGCPVFKNTEMQNQIQKSKEGKISGLVHICCLTGKTEKPFGRVL